MSGARIGVVDVGVANLRSVANALTHLGLEHRTVDSAAALAGCTHVILPGVGAFDTAMNRLNAAGLTQPLREFAAAARPVLGLCLGMQLLVEHGVEGDAAEGLGLLPGRVERLGAERLPHVGWNAVDHAAAHPLLAGARSGADYYFVHSYHVVTDAEVVLATSEYGQRFVAVLGRGNIVGCQFHPEKSQRSGLALLERFGAWDGTC
ncbi:MAG TPA: imidazole glycerol phosphate synthase subunit HisH [Longimicrobiales bacterium]|nr:imidazole glycerol phosphate synthase subunit HisH [Longimicrobiales bacterium]